MWILGDQGYVGGGYASANVNNVHTQFINSAWKDSMDLILMLGDNAYNSGHDWEFQQSIFETKLDSVMRNTPLYSCVGNHEVRYSTSYGISNVSTTPYYVMHSFPIKGEAGGVASNTKSYYAFDYANVHIMSFNAEEEDLDSATSTMWTWAKTQRR